MATNTGNVKVETSQHLIRPEMAETKGKLLRISLLLKICMLASWWATCKGACFGVGSDKNFFSSSSSSTINQQYGMTLPFQAMLPRASSCIFSPRLSQSPKVRLSMSNLSVVSFSKTSILPSTYLSLLAVQFAIQPILTKRYAAKGIIRSTYVLAQDFIRLLISAFLLTITQSWTVACQNWTFRQSLASAGIPSVLYLIQSYCSLIAYQNLSPITYNVLNQTKTIAAAVFCFLIIGQSQSFLQMLSLGILLLAALIMENMVPVPAMLNNSRSHKHLNSFEIKVHEADIVEDTKCIERAGTIPSTERAMTSEKSRSSPPQKIGTGIVPILVASLLSGLAGAWTQKCLSGTSIGGSNNSLLFTFQLSIYSILLLGTTLIIPGVSPDRKLATSKISGGSWYVGWTSKTWIPIVVNAIGGVLVGLVTKCSGVVQKGFALIIGMFLSGLLQNKFSSESVTKQQWIGGLLAAISIWMHTSYPH